MRFGQHCMDTRHWAKYLSSLIKIMSQFEVLKNKLPLVESIIKEWKDCHAKILSYDGSSGIAGHLYILFHTSRGNFFLMSCKACTLFETRFQWQTKQLSFDVDTDSSEIIIRDRLSNLRIHAEFVQIVKLLNNDAVSSIYNRIFSGTELPIIYSSGMERLNSLHQLDRIGYKSPNLNVGEFKPYTNILDIVLQYTSEKKDLSDYSISLILCKPSYLYFKQKKIDLLEIKIQRHNDIFRITDLLEECLLIECNEILICNTNKFTSYSLRAKENIEWFLSMPTFLNLNPQLLISLNT
jgi:hypothetical protein